MNRNTENITLAAEKLYKLTLSTNRGSAKEQGFYDGRFSTKVEPNKKRTEHLKLRRNKHIL